MKIAIVYTGITSYMSDCWRELAGRIGVELRIWIEDTKAYRFKGDRAKALQGLSCHWDYSENLTDIELGQAEHEIAAFAPDVIFVCGWSCELPPYIARSKRLAHIPMILELDMPWEWRIRKIAARFLLRRRLRRFKAVFVPGKCSARYARWLGFPENRVFTGRNCIAVEKFLPTNEDCGGAGFLFLGRHVKEKGLDVLRKGYKEYIRLGGTWGMDIPEFVEPLDVPQVMHSHRCLIVPSKWEPWGVVVLEAIVAGMLVVVSDKVGARLDLPVDFVFKSGDYKTLARIMVCIEKDVVCQDMKNKNVERCKLLKRFDVSEWADRVIRISNDVAKM